MPARPNIVFILADDMGYGDVTCYNPESRIPTPNMDRLAAGGVRFLDAHSSSAVCTPSRYGILTGRYCWRSRLKRSVLFGYEPPLIEPGRPTVAGFLRRAGYRTACVGKWHLGLGYSARPGEEIDFGAPLPWPNATQDFEERVDFGRGVAGGPTELGFDYFYGTSGCPTCQPPYGFIENDRFVELPTEYRPTPPFSGRPGMTAPGWRHMDADPEIARRAVGFVEAQRGSDRPFFLYVASSAPHEPCVEEVVPEFARGMSEAGPRGDLVWLFDWMVGEVTAALERAGRAEGTIVMVTSDNGALPGDRVRRGGEGMAAYRTYGHRSCGDWRGYKAHIWEGGHREPLIARWPGRIAPGTTSGATVCLGDLFATVAEMLGEPLPDGAAEDSVSFLPALTGDPGAGPARDHVVHHSGAGVFSVRQGRWKCIFETKGSGGWPPPRGGGPEPGTAGQLYDLDADPAEARDLWDERPEEVERLAALLNRCRDDGRTRP